MVQLWLTVDNAIFVGGCTFEEDSNADLCEYRQEQDDDFDWQLVRTSSWPSVPSDLTWGSYMLVNSSQHSAGQQAQLLLHTLSENDTHCVQFSYFLYSRDGHSPGRLSVYVQVNGGPLGNSVWNISGSQGYQWHQVELAVSTFWPSEYQKMKQVCLIKLTIREELQVIYLEVTTDKVDMGQLIRTLWDNCFHYQTDWRSDECNAKVIAPKGT
ncbi:Receptor-type tyrosine-protein phosphatase U [Bagarius yarrelli]|uniref:Receptor-type tyrosine-protein phosphatase U n=1 Tax=Bagarius yarrelli TaxID=175774 RepID=A0A556TNQ6_BAGYA|nr:Receptor-type tyrosine-protein phosphatase U [Bagarius yarrelli]